MGNYNVEFTVDDVVRKLEEVKAMCNGGKDNFLRTFTHEEGGRLGSQRNFLTALLEPIISKEEENKELWNKAQKELLEKLKDTLTFEKIITEFLDDGGKNFQNYQVPPREFVAQYREKLVKACDFFPVYERITSLGNSNEEQNENLKTMDFHFHMFIHYANRIFSPGYSTDEFYLHSDIGNFTADIKNSVGDQGISVRETQMDKVRMHVDFIPGVILPLVSNVVEHSLNPENDIYDRINDEKLKGVVIDGHYPEDDLWFYRVAVMDNGFGMTDEVAAKVLDGYSTKPEDGRKHGIGISEAAKFVRRYGGEMTLETELGKGTQFIFTIPIIKGQSEPYVQAPMPEN